MELLLAMLGFTVAVIGGQIVKELRRIRVTLQDIRSDFIDARFEQRRGL